MPLVLVVNPSVPAKNLQELIAYLKSKQGQMQYASFDPPLLPVRGQ